MLGCDSHLIGNDRPIIFEPYLKVLHITLNKERKHQQNQDGGYYNER